MSGYEGRPTVKQQLVLSGKCVDLLALAERHLPLVIAWRNNPAIRQRFFNRRTFTAASQLDWFARYAVDPTAFNFVIAQKGGRTIGTVAISKIDWRERTGEFGRFLIGDPVSIGCGYGREAAGLILDFARSELGLTSVSLVVLPGNAAAVRLYRKLGFVEAGTFPRETSDRTTELALRMVLALGSATALGSPESDAVPS